MPDVRYRGAYAEAYIRTLALAAGLNVLRAEVDDDGVDVMIRYTGEVGLVASPGIDVQVKSWSTPKGSDQDWHFDRLNEQQFNKLIGNHQMPRYLIMLVVPSEQVRLAELFDDGLLLRHCAYYVPVDGMTRIDDPSARRRRQVRIPKANLLTPNTLRRLLHADLASV